MRYYLIKQRESRACRGSTQSTARNKDNIIILPSAARNSFATYRAPSPAVSFVTSLSNLQKSFYHEQCRFHIIIIIRSPPSQSSIRSRKLIPHTCDVPHNIYFFSDILVLVNRLKFKLCCGKTLSK